MADATDTIDQVPAGYDINVNTGELVPKNAPQYINGRELPGTGPGPAAQSPQPPPTQPGQSSFGIIDPELAEESKDIQLGLVAEGTPQAPKLSWDQISGHEDFQKLSPEQKTTVLGNYTRESRDYLQSLEGQDPNAVDKNIESFYNQAYGAFQPKIGQAQQFLGGVESGIASVIKPGADIVNAAEDWAFGTERNKSGSLGNSLQAAADFFNQQGEKNAPGISEWKEKPWVSPGALETAAKYNPIQYALDKLAPGSTIDKLYGGFSKGMADTLAGFTSPENIGMLIAGGGAGVKGGKAVAGLFTAMGLAQLPSQIKTFQEETDPAKKVAIATQAVASITLPAAGLFLHAPAEKALSIPIPNMDQLPEEMLKSVLKNEDSTPAMQAAVNNELIRRQFVADNTKANDFEAKGFPQAAQATREVSIETRTTAIKDASAKIQEATEKQAAPAEVVSEKPAISPAGEQVQKNENLIKQQKGGEENGRSNIRQSENRGAGSPVSEPPARGQADISGTTGGRSNEGRQRQGGGPAGTGTQAERPGVVSETAGTGSPAQRQVTGSGGGESEPAPLSKWHEKYAAEQAKAAAAKAAEAPVAKAEVAPTPVAGNSVEEIAHNAKRDFDKQVKLPEGATALRVTSAEGRKTIVPERDLKGANPMHEAGPFSKVEAGALGRRGEFIPIKEPIQLRQDFKSPIGNELPTDETAHERATAQTVDEIAKSGRYNTESAEGGTAPAPVEAQGSAKNEAAETATAIQPSSADSVNRNYNNVRSVLDSFGLSNNAEAKDIVFDRVRDDLIQNTRDTGDPTKVASGANYNAKLIATQELTKFQQLHENAKRSATPFHADKETAGQAIEETKAAEPAQTPKQRPPYHDEVVKIRARALSHFAKRIDVPKDAAPNATRAQVLRAASLVTDELTGAKFEQFGGRGKKGPVDALRNDPAFRKAVQDRVIGDITQDTKALIGKDRDMASLADMKDLKEATLYGAKLVAKGVPLHEVMPLLPKAIKEQVKAAETTIGADKGGSNTVMGHIAKDSEATPEQRALASFLDGKGRDMPVTIDPTLAARRRAGGLTDEYGQISLWPGLSKETLRWTALHEKIHDVVAGKIAKYLRGDTHLLDSQDVAALDELSQLRKDVLEHESVPQAVRDALEGDTHDQGNRLFKAAGDDARKLYPLLNLHEFVTGALTNEKFQDFVDKIKSTTASEEKGASLWEKIRDTLKRLILGRETTPDSVLDKAVDRSLDIINRTQGKDLNTEFLPAENKSPASEFKEDMERQGKFLDNFAKEHGFDSVSQMALSDPELFNEVARQYRNGSNEVSHQSPVFKEDEPESELERAVNRLIETSPKKDLPKLAAQIRDSAEPENVKARVYQNIARAIVSSGDKAEGPLGLKTFAKEDVAGVIKKGIDIAKATKDFFVNTFWPRAHAERDHLDTLFEAKGRKDEEVFKASAAMENQRRVMSKIPREEQMAFADRIKRGEIQPTPELQQLASLLREWDDRAHAEISKYKPDLPYLENHMRVMWKVIPGSEEALAGLKGDALEAAKVTMSKRPWQGTKGMLKRHTLSDMSEGIALGGVPISYNPVELQLLSHQDAMKFISANRAWDGWKKIGAAEFVKKGDAPPPDYVKVNDSIAKVYFPTEKGAVSPGEYYIHEGVGRLLNNYLSRDHIRENALGRGLMDLKNASTGIELGLSPFHAVFESNETIGSSVGLGLSKIFTGHIASGFKDIVTAPASFVGTAKLGGAAIRFARNAEEFEKSYPEAYKWFTKNYPNAESLIHDMFTGGGRVDMHEDYRILAGKGFESSLQEGNYGRALLQAAPALNAQVMKPLFEKYIPRLKVGMFLRDYSFELQRRGDDLASGKITSGELARQTWDFVDDRFGELNWDNLFWDRTFKSAAQLTFRSVTWKLGNVRGFGKAARDTVAELGVNWWKEGRAPRMTLPMGWLVGMSLVTALQSSIISKVTTGKYPWELAENAGELVKQLIFPRIDAKDASQRVSIPTYWRDAVHLQHSPTDYVKTSMAGEWGRIGNVWQNKDFYGTEVYHPDDPTWKTGVEALEHMVPLPFGLQSFIASQKAGQTPLKSAFGFGGFTKAPYYVSHSPAEIQASDLMRAQLPQGARTKEQYEKAVKERQAVAAIKRGETTLPSAIAEGMIDRKRAPVVRKKIQDTPLQYTVSRLSAKDSMKVYETASAAERKTLSDIVRLKIARSASATGSEKIQMQKHLRELTPK